MKNNQIPKAVIDRHQQELEKQSEEACIKLTLSDGSVQTVKIVKPEKDGE